VPRLLRAALAVWLCVVLPCVPAHGAAAATPLIHVVRPGDTLSEIAVQYGVRLAELRRWNSLRGDGITVGQSLEVHRGGPAAQYVVRPGDTLSEIALRHGQSLARLRQLNGLRGDHIAVGQKLRLTAPTPSPAPAPEPAGPTRIYVVRPGDTLSEIALAYGLDLARLRQLNRLDGDTIRAGQKLRVQVTPAQAQERPAAGYTVRPGDTLSEIAARHDVGLVLLRQINRLASDRIHPGQKLVLRPSPQDEPVHVVRYGETLSEIALEYRLDTAQLRRINGLEGDRILAGQKLRLKDTPAAVHLVERGDALWEIAQAYSMSVAELKSLNGLSSNRIYPGQELKLDPGKAGATAEYVVAPGDNLIEIARLHQMSVAELRRLNRLEGSIIHPGQRLVVRPFLALGGKWLEAAEIPWEELAAAPSDMARLEVGNGPYFGAQPRARWQKGMDYYEETGRSPRQAYPVAARLWQRFEAKVGALGRLSNALAGWHVVIDPGHGGLDPGAIVPSLGGDGRRLYVVEDEYCYDLALRTYVLLRLHGAQVHMTILSPNHLIRQNAPASLTFVNEKSEVYNSLALSRAGRSGEWPRGTAKGLRHRVEIAREALRGAPQSRTVFLSFHADITPGAPEAHMVLYYESRDGRRRDTTSRAFAKALLPALGAGAHTRGQGLAVLRDNPAQYKVLVEMRNLAYVDHAWALRFGQLRQRDAEKLAKGLVDFARGQRLARR